MFSERLFAKDREKRSNERDKKEKEKGIEVRVRRKANKIYLKRVSSFCSRLFFLIILTLLYA